MYTFSKVASNLDLIEGNEGILQLLAEKTDVFWRQFELSHRIIIFRTRHRFY